jgi:Rod binding domain-containing protein
MQIDASMNVAGYGEPKSSASGRDPQKVKEAAKEFEALLLGQMLKTVRESSGADGWMGSGGGSTDSVMEYAEQNLAAVLSSNGGLGLARLVSDGLTKSVKIAEAAAATGQTGGADTNTLRAK